MNLSRVNLSVVIDDNSGLVVNIYSWRASGAIIQRVDIANRFAEGIVGVGKTMQGNFKSGEIFLPYDPVVDRQRADIVAARIGAELERNGVRE